MLSKAKLSHIARVFLAEEFGINLMCPVVINGRLKRSLARYVYWNGEEYTKVTRVKQIEVSKQLLDYGTEEEIIGCLKHECVHLALHYLGMPFADGDYHFEATLAVLGVPATNVIRLEKPFHTYECACCKEYLTSTKKLNSNYHHKKCGPDVGLLRYVGFMKKDEWAS